MKTNLSQIHIEILRWVAIGKTAELIARIMNMTVRQVRARQAELHQILGTSTLAHAVAEGFRRGVLQ